MQERILCMHLSDYHTTTIILLLCPYPIKGDSFLHTGLEPEGNNNAKTKETNISPGEIEHHHPMKILLLFDWVGESGDTGMDHECIDEDGNRIYPPSRVKLNHNILKRYVLSAIVETARHLIGSTCQILQ